MENANRAEILKSIEEESGDSNEQAGQKPLDSAQFEQSKPAVEAEGSEEGKLAQLGSETATQIQRVFERKSLAEDDRSSQLEDIKTEFLSQAKMFAPGLDQKSALKVLAAQLKSVHDSYFEAARSGVNDEAMSRDLEAKAAEIDAFSRSLGKSETISGDEATVTSEAGQAFLARLKSGEFPDPMLAQAELASSLADKLSEDEFKTLFKLAGEIGS